MYSACITLPTMSEDIDYEAIGDELNRLIEKKAQEDGELEQLMLRIAQLPTEQADAISGSGSDARKRRGLAPAKALYEQQKDLEEQAVRKRQSIGRLVDKIYELKAKLAK